MFEEMFNKARKSMVLDKEPENKLTGNTIIRLTQIKKDDTTDAKMHIGEISHRKDGDYRKVGEGKFVPVSKEKSNQTETQKRKPPLEAETTKRNMTSGDLTKNFKDQKFNHDNESFNIKGANGEKISGKIKADVSNKHEGCSQVEFKDDRGETVHAVIDYDKQTNTFDQIIIAKNKESSDELFRKHKMRLDE